MPFIPACHRRREKLFGVGRPVALDRNAKVRIMHLARCLTRRTEPGKAYGVVTAKALAVLEALLWAFHNAKSGLCFPSYERIAEAAGCARSTVAEAIRALEDAGILPARRSARLKAFGAGPETRAAPFTAIQCASGRRFGPGGSSTRQKQASHPVLGVGAT